MVFWVASLTWEKIRVRRGLGPDHWQGTCSHFGFDCTLVSLYPVRIIRGSMLPRAAAWHLRPCSSAKTILFPLRGLQYGAGARLRKAGVGSGHSKRHFHMEPTSYSATMAMARKNHGKEFWSKIAEEKIDWFRSASCTLDESRSPMNRWFPDGTINLCYNALDRHVYKGGRATQPAIIYESNVGGLSRTITYEQLLADVSKLAGYLRYNMHVNKGDRVLIYMPMIPETIVAMLACVRIGAVHSVVFGGFAPQELATRIDDCTPDVIITASCGIEGENRVLPYMPIVNKALAAAKHKVRNVIVKQRREVAAQAAMHDMSKSPGRDQDFDQGVLGGTHVECAHCTGSDPLYILYTSGTTGKPKGILRDNSHIVPLAWSMEGFMGCKPGEAFFCGADVGWAVGHSYTVYAPLIAGCTTILYEGKPVGTPDAAAYWRVVEKHRPAGMFTAPTALRAIRQNDPHGTLMRECDTSSLRTLFVAGERADPDTVNHFQRLLGIAVVDHWWQTESGTPMSGIQIDGVGTTPGSCGLPVPGYDIAVLDPSTGSKLSEPHAVGDIAIKLPLPPGFMSTLFQNDDLFIKTYFSKYPGYYQTGDCGFKDENGYIHVMSRTDDVINVAGHRLTTGQLEEICISHPAVVECAVVGTQDAIKGVVPVALLVISDRNSSDEQLAKVSNDVVAMVREQLGAWACLKRAAVVHALPKTRSGKILRNVIRAISDGRPYVVPPTIEDEEVLDGIKVAVQRMGYGVDAKSVPQGASPKCDDAAAVTAQLSAGIGVVDAAIREYPVGASSPKRAHDANDAKSLNIPPPSMPRRHDCNVEAN